MSIVDVRLDILMIKSKLQRIKRSSSDLPISCKQAIINVIAKLKSVEDVLKVKIALESVLNQGEENE